MNDSQSFLSIIGGAALVALLILLSLEIWEQRSRRQAREQAAHKAAVQDAFDMGYREGFEESAYRGYANTEACLKFKDWHSYKEWLERVGGDES